jgi:hypothetical protein
MELITEMFLFAWPVLSWVVIAVLSYSLLVFVVMEFAVNHSQSRSEDGSLRIKRLGFVMQELYGVNSCYTSCKNYPRNICQMYRGIWLGVLIFLGMGLLTAVIFSFGAVGGFFLGYLPLRQSGSKEFYHKRERYGEYDEKKWIAPWKIIIPLVAIFYFRTVAKGIVIISKLGMSFIFSEAMLVIMTIIVAVLMLVVLALNFPKFKNWLLDTATWEYVRGVKKKMCVEVDIV